MTSLDVMVLLGSRFGELERHGTRWRALLTRWAADPRVDRLEVVDYPRFRPGRAVVTGARSWIAGVTVHDVTVPLPVRPTPLDGFGWRQAAQRLNRTGGPRRVVIAATPLWVPVLPYLDADRRCFDAVDDWRGLPSAARARARVEQGYRAARTCDVVTAVSRELADRLHRDFGVTAQVHGNGVDLASYQQHGPEPAGLPDQPFAVYVGSVQSRVDISLLAAVVREIPVVVAGPADDAAAAQLRSSAVQWLGPIDVALVPGLLRRAAVGLLPHRVDAFTASMDPMKLLEYLAAGLPVVSTSLPGLPASDRLHTADGPDAFTAAVRIAMKDDGPRAPDPAVLDRDWTVVADRLLDACTGAAR